MVLEKFQLDNKVAVVTGGAGLLGRRHCEALLEAGGRVAVLDLSAAKLEEAKSWLKEFDSKRWLICESDITKKESVRAARQAIESKFGEKARILVNNAAIDPKFDKPTGGQSGHGADKGPTSRLENFSLEQWNLELSVGLTGSLVCAQEFGVPMAQDGGGVILNVASDLGVVAPDQRLYAKHGLPDDRQNVKPVTYSVIKHGLIGMTKYIATYWADRGVRCNAFAPGGVFNNHPEEFVTRISKLIPMGRMAHLDEYKASILFLVSDASSYMNGAVLVMDGGRSVW